MEISEGDYYRGLLIKNPLQLHGEQGRLWSSFGFHKTQQEKPHEECTCKNVKTVPLLFLVQQKQHSSTVS